MSSNYLNFIKYLEKISIYTLGIWSCINLKPKLTLYQLKS